MKIPKVSPELKTESFLLKGRNTINSWIQWGLAKKRINTMLITNNTEVLQLNEEIARYITRHDYLSATEKLAFIKNKYGVDYPNLIKQIQMHELFTRKVHTRNDVEDLLERIQQLLEQSMPLENISLRPALENETLLINRIGSLYGKLEKVNEAIRLYKEIINSFYSSRIDNRYYRGKNILLMENFATKLELLEEYDEEIELFKKCLSLYLKLGRGSSLGWYTSTLIHFYSLKAPKGTKKATLYSGSLELLKLYYREEDYQKLLEQ